MKIEQIQKILLAGEVNRFHTTPLFKEQNDAAHSWGVCMILNAICDNVSKDLLLAALWHDVAELHTGDIPAPAKDSLNLLDLEYDFLEYLDKPKFDINNKEYLLLYIADKLEFLRFTFLYENQCCEHKLNEHGANCLYECLKRERICFSDSELEKIVAFIKKYSRANEVNMRLDLLLGESRETK